MGKKVDTRNFQIDHRVKAKSDDPLYHLHEYGIHLRANQIYLFGDGKYANEEGMDPGVEFIMANKFIKNIQFLMRSSDDPILIHMKTCGGFWEEGMAIYDAIRACPNPITILNYTHARSMSSIIFQAANKRVMLPNSTFMFHDGTLGIEGTLKQVYSAVNFNKHADKKMLDIYGNVMNEQGNFKGNGITKIKTWLRTQMDKKEEVYLTADETVKYGLADEIFDSNWANLTKYTESQLER